MKGLEINMAERQTASHFDSAEQAGNSARLGIRIFLSSELIMFGGLLCVFFVFRSWHPAVFNQGTQYLYTKLGAIGTLFLITSSFTMALAGHYLRLDRIKFTVLNLLFTLLCASVFIGIRYYEFSHNIQTGALWQGLFSAPGFTDQMAATFFSLYFLLGGAHSLHVLAGLYLCIRLIKRAMKYQYSSGNSVPVEITGMFWHMGVFIWIILFPLMYLI